MIPATDIVEKGVPTGWSTVPFWSLFRREKKTGYPQEELLSVYRDYGVIPKSSRDDNHNKESEDLSGYQLVTEGALVTNKMKAWQGSIAISRYRGIVSPAYYVYTPQSDECDQFLHYLLRSDPYIALYGRISKGVRVNQWDLEHEALRNIPVLLPDLTTQHQIADFLDRETARIDLLIEKKQRLVALLEEKLDRMVRALVSGETYYSAPDQRKATGIGYFPFAPKHWSIEKIGWRYEIQLGKMLDSAKQTGNHVRRYLRATDVQWGRINTTNLPEMDFSPSDRQRFRLQKGDLLVNEGGAVGRSAIWQSDEQEIYYQKAVHRVRPRDPERDSTEFLYYVMWFATKHGVFTAGGNQTTISHLTAEALGRYRFGFPSLDEQRKISGRLRTEENLVGHVSLKIQNSIDRLKEYRSALITAAVTGQIDVQSDAKSSTTDRLLDAIQEKMEV